MHPVLEKAEEREALIARLLANQAISPTPVTTEVAVSDDASDTTTPSCCSSSGSASTGSSNAGIDAAVGSSSSAGVARRVPTPEAEDLAASVGLTDAVFAAWRGHISTIQVLADQEVSRARQDALVSERLAEEARTGLDDFRYHFCYEMELQRKKTADAEALAERLKDQLKARGFGSPAPTRAPPQQEQPPGSAAAFQQASATIGFREEKRFWETMLANSRDRSPERPIRALHGDAPSVPGAEGGWRGSQGDFDRALWLLWRGATAGERCWLLCVALELVLPWLLAACLSVFVETSRRPDPFEVSVERHGAMPPPTAAHSRLWVSFSTPWFQLGLSMVAIAIIAMIARTAR